MAKVRISGVQKWFEEAKLGIFIHYRIYAVSCMDSQGCVALSAMAGRGIAGCRENR
ncbi:alpha-L-fucosidase [Paenibacillus thiaminolyticus]|uniref:alpha-L-fucosidase n=1 Tax=Paenibacillus thiaminolyticus TaxID=49283 RepID=UPI003D26F26C